MDKIRTVVIDFYINRRREFFMLVLLGLLVLWNVQSYLTGSPYNLPAMIFGQRGKQTAETQTAQENQPSAPAQAVQENQKLQEAANNLDGNTPTQPAQTTQNAAQETQKEDANAVQAETAGGNQQPPSAQQNQPTFQVPQVTNSAQAQTSYQELDTMVFYRDDPFKPIVTLPVQIQTTSVPAWTPPPVVRRVCGTIIAGAGTMGSVSLSGSAFAWPTEKSLPTSFEGGIPALPGVESDGTQNEKSSEGALQLTGIIYDSQPVANIKFNGKYVSVKLNGWIGSCRVVAISKNQVVLSEPGGKQRRLYL